MKFQNVAVLSVAHVDAPLRLTSAAMEARIEPALRRMGLRPGMLEAFSGIKARRLWPEDVQPSDAATLAAQRAMSLAKVEPGRIGALINTSVCRDFVEPSVASLVHRNLRLEPHCVNFDIANACLGFLNGMEIVGNMIERGQIDCGLIVDGESSRYVIEQTLSRLQAPESTLEEFRGSFATLTLGSGAAAMLLCRADLVPTAPKFTGSVTLAASQYNHLCRGQNDRMETDSQGLLQAGVELAGMTWQAARKELGWSPEVLDELVMHQVSKVHTERLTRTLGLEVQKVLAIYPEYGNVGPASVPIVLSKAWESGRIQRGNRIALMGIGSGLNCAMAEIVW